MKIFKGYTDFYIDGNTSISIGMFDGVHLGHQSIIQSIVDKAREKGLVSVVFTFEPHPRLFFNPNDDLKHLTLYEEKIKLISDLGVDAVVFQKFDEQFSQLTGEDFISKVIVERLKARHITIGHDHSFGKNKSGNFDLLQTLSPQYSYTLQDAQAVMIENEIVSSTKIRNALMNGNITKANTFLGYAYSLSGKVIHGKKLGRTIGYPTANISVPDNKLLPKFGAYIVEVYLDGQFHPGMLSIGNNPTFDEDCTSVEVHILDFDKDIYDKQIKVVFREFLHEQIKFPSMEGLITRLDEDKRRTKDFFENQ